MATHPPSLNTASPFSSWKSDHPGLRAPDFYTAVAWYKGKIDFRGKHSWQMGDKTFALISPAVDDSFSFELMAGPGAELRPSYDDLPGSHKLTGWHHVCFRVESVHDTIAEQKRRGVRFCQLRREEANNAADEA